jgi:hypothetical protein
MGWTVKGIGVPGLGFTRNMEAIDVEEERLHVMWGREAFAFRLEVLLDMVLFPGWI